MDAHGRETGIADEILAAGFACFCQVRPSAKFFGYEILVLPSEHVTNVAASPPPRGMRALALALGVLPTSVDADKVPAHRAVFVDEHCALRDDVAGVTIVQHLLSNSLTGGHTTIGGLCCCGPPYRSFAD